MITRTRTYVTESWAELRKVAWPTRRQVVNLSLIVIVVSAIVGAYIAILDFLLLIGMDRLLTP
ncbi:MAG: preprotein translocase subunit SecE [Chloroflexota bacterium]